MLDNDADLLRSLVAISLANTVATDTGTIKVVARFMGIDETMIDNAIETAEERYGLRLLALSEGAALALV